MEKLINNVLLKVDEMEASRNEDYIEAEVKISESLKIVITCHRVSSSDTMDKSMIGTVYSIDFSAYVNDCLVDEITDSQDNKDDVSYLVRCYQ